MHSAPIAMLIDPALGAFLVWVAMSVAMTVILVTWLFRPAAAGQPLKAVGAAWLVMTLLVVLVSSRISRRSSSQPAQPAEAPNFTLRTLDGQEFTRDSFRGKVVMLEFWASWCGPCREALPDVVKLYREFSGKNFVMIGVSEDDDQAQLERFILENNIRWQQDWDKGGVLLDQFKTTAIPSYAVIDSGGRLRLLEEGWAGDTYLLLRKAIAGALGQPTRVAAARR
jgi:thiol-disulfide isomerase/thioredoxin